MAVRSKHTNIAPWSKNLCHFSETHSIFTIAPSLTSKIACKFSFSHSLRNIFTITYMKSSVCHMRRAIARVRLKLRRRGGWSHVQNDKLLFHFANFLFETTILCWKLRGSKSTLRSRSQGFHFEIATFASKIATFLFKIPTCVCVWNRNVSV